MQEMTPPYTCQFCGMPSWYDESEQTMPPDYCHPSDHGEPEDTPPSEVVLVVDTFKNNQ